MICMYPHSDNDDDTTMSLPVFEPTKLSGLIAAWWIEFGSNPRAAVLEPYARKHKLAV